jgi:PPM family protein phosphatase
LTGATALHKGDREYQQDQVLLMAHPSVAGCLAAVVCDGMGGKTGGRKAADQAMLVAQQLFTGYAPSRDKGADFCTSLVKQAHATIRLTAVTSEEEPHGALAAVVVNPDRSCDIVHVGDARVYHFRGNRLLARTKDHSYVQKLVDRGLLDPDEADNHPKASVLLACLGTVDDPPIPLGRIPELMLGDALLVCSDGLWHYFKPPELAYIISSLSAGEASKELLRLARERAQGMGDNLSLALIKAVPPA